MKINLKTSLSIFHELMDAMDDFIDVVENQQFYDHNASWEYNDDGEKEYFSTMTEERKGEFIYHHDLIGDIRTDKARYIQDFETLDFESILECDLF